MNTVAEFLDKSFDVKFALSALYLWLLFGYLSSMVNCDLQRLIQENWIFRHIIGLVSFLLLFTIIDLTSTDISIPIILVKTVVVYTIFLLLIKSKWYFSLPVLSLLVIDQLIKSHITYITNKNNKDERITYYNNVRKVLGIVIYILIFIGFIAYLIRQKMEFGDDFKITTFLFSSKCRTN